MCGRAPRAVFIAEQSLAARRRRKIKVAATLRWRPRLTAPTAKTRKRVRERKKEYEAKGGKKKSTLKSHKSVLAGRLLFGHFGHSGHFRDALFSPAHRCMRRCALPSSRIEITETKIAAKRKAKGGC